MKLYFYRSLWKGADQGLPWTFNSWPWSFCTSWILG